MTFDSLTLWDVARVRSLTWATPAGDARRDRLNRAASRFNRLYKSIDVASLHPAGSLRLSVSLRSAVLSASRREMYG